MGDVKHLQGNEAIDKLKEIAEEVDICMFCTDVDQIPFPTRPMSTQEVDEEGNLWFMSNKGSHKNDEIKTESKVQLIYGNTAKSNYLSVAGTAHILYDREKIEKFWSPIMKAWFNEGKDDPNITLIKVVPQESYYWDTKDGRVVSMLKIVVGAITGQETDGSIQGKISV